MFTINGMDWRVYLVSPTHPMLEKNGTYALGCCDSWDRKIYINDMLNTYYTKKVLCHEIVHAAMYSYNIILTYDEEETIAELITNFGEEIIELTNKLFSTMSKQ